MVPILWSRGWLVLAVGMLAGSNHCESCGQDCRMTIVGTYRFFRLFRAYGVSWKYELLGLRCSSCAANIRGAGADSAEIRRAALPKSKAVPFADLWGLVLFAVLYVGIGSLLFLLIPNSAWPGVLIVAALIIVAISMATKREQHLNALLMQNSRVGIGTADPPAVS